MAAELPAAGEVAEAETPHGEGGPRPSPEATPRAPRPYVRGVMRRSADERNGILSRSRKTTQRVARRRRSSPGPERPHRTLMIRVRLGGMLLASLVVGGACHSPSTVAIAAKGPARTPPGQDGPSAAIRAVGDRVALGVAGGSVGVTAVERHVDAGRLFPPPRGDDYFAAHVEGCAAPTESAVLFKPEYFGVQLADRTVHDAGPGMKKPDLRGGPIPAGRCLDGWVTFAIPKDQNPVAVVYDGSEQIHWALTK